MSCKSMSNDESLIYVLVSWVFHNVHFRHFGDLKMRFQIIRNGSYLVNNFEYTCIGIRNICEYHIFVIVISDC